MAMGLLWREAIYLGIEKPMFDKQYLLQHAEIMGHEMDTDF